MSVGQRLKAARHAAGLSLRALAERAGVSAQAISKYERDLNMPSSGVLVRLAEALGVKVEYFFRTREVRLSAPHYRKRASLPKKQEHAVLGRIQEELERYLEVESLFPADAEPRFDLPSRQHRRATSLDDVERAAIDLRETWDLGLGPIENMTELLESRGIKVELIDGHDRFDACTLLANETIPVIAIKRGLPGDRQRFNLAHELGHLVLETAAGLDKEKAAYRFAGAFVVPAPVARSELGRRRHTLDPLELHLLKHKYGLSMQGWIYRAKDLGIISDSEAARLFKQFRVAGRHKEEPGDALPPESSQRLKQLVLRALVEDLISESRAGELLGKPLEVVRQEEARLHGGILVGVRR